MDYSEKNDSITFRTNSSLKAELEKLAKEDGRKLSNYIDQVLIKHVEAKKEKK